MLFVWLDIMSVFVLLVMKGVLVKSLVVLHIGCDCCRKRAFVKLEEQLKSAKKSQKSTFLH